MIEMDLKITKLLRFDYIGTRKVHRVIAKGSFLSKFSRLSFSTSDESSVCISVMSCYCASMIISGLSKDVSKHTPNKSL